MKNQNVFVRGFCLKLIITILKQSRLYLTYYNFSKAIQLSLKMKMIRSQKIHHRQRSMLNREINKLIKMATKEKARSSCGTIPSNLAVNQATINRRSADDQRRSSTLIKTSLVLTSQLKSRGTSQTMRCTSKCVSPDENIDISPVTMFCSEKEKGRTLSTFVHHPERFQRKNLAQLNFSTFYCFRNIFFIKNSFHRKKPILFI